MSAPAIEPNAERGEVNGADKAAERWIRDSIQPLVDSSVLESDHNRSVYEYWTSKKGSRAFPHWRDLSLMEIYAAAPYVTVKDVVDGGRDLRNRFWGTGLTENFGFEATGRSMREVYGQKFDVAAIGYRSAIDRNGPTWVRGKIWAVEGKEYVDHEAVHLPLGGADDPETIAHIMSAYAFFSPSGD